MKETNKMKKIMIAAAIVCAAAMSQAAQINWGSNGMKLCDTAGNPIGGLDSPQSLVLVNLGTTINWANASIVEVGTGKATLNTITPTASGSKMGLVNGVVAFDWTSGGSNNYIDNGDYLALMVYNSETKELSKLVYTTDGNPEVSNEAVLLVSGIVNPSDTIKNQKIGFSTNFAAASVPEPTSAMLLLLGVAGLALKRKRA